MLRVVGVGDNFVDRYWDENTMYPGGNSVNFTVYARQMGVFSAYCGVLAQDREAALIERALQRYDVEYAHCLRLPGGQTGTGSIRLVDGDRVITDDNAGGSVRTDPLPITDELLLYLKTFDVIHMCCYGYLEPQLPRIASIRVPILYDFSDQWQGDAFERVCPWIQVAFFSGGACSCEALEQALRRAVACGASIAIVTMGAAGAMAYDGKKFYIKRPYAVNAGVLDTMGAGDAFLTGFAVAYYSGLKLFRSMERAEDRMASRDMRDHQEHLLEYALCSANHCAMKSCSTRGAFGMGQRITDP